MGYLVPFHAVLSIGWDRIGPARPAFGGRALDRQGVKQGVKRVVLPCRGPAL